MLMPGRNKQSEEYRYGFNGMERDDEVKGAGNSYDFGARMYDSRLGRWKSLDPLAATYPSMSPYIFVGNSPILFIDPDGMRIINGHEIAYNDAKLRYENAKKAYDNINKSMKWKVKREIKKEYKKSSTLYFDVKPKYERVKKHIKFVETNDEDLHKKMDKLQTSDGQDVNIYIYSSDHSYRTETTKVRGNTRYKMSGHWDEKKRPHYYPTLPYEDSKEVGVEIYLYGDATETTIANEYGDTEYVVVYGEKAYNAEPEKLPNQKGGNWKKYEKSEQKKFSEKRQNEFKEKIKKNDN